MAGLFSSSPQGPFDFYLFITLPGQELGRWYEIYLSRKKNIKRTVFVHSRDKQWGKTQVSGSWQGDFRQACRSELFGTAWSKAKHRKTPISKLNLRNLDAVCNFGYSKCKIDICSSVTMRVLNTYNPTYEYELMTDLEMHSNQTQSQKKKKKGEMDHLSSKS